MADKIVTDNILQKATEGIIQLIADNIFEFESYNDTEIAELFSLTPEEAQHISDLIADTVISQYKLWSSKKVSDELLSAKNECNDYTDDRLSGISSISLKYCEELPDVGESNCIYILKSTDSNPDTLNLYDSDNTTWISIGDFNISLDDVYKKSEVDTKLDLKADKTEILAQDDVLTDISLATTTNVLSATTTIKELDKKVDKTSIATTIDENSTDDEVVGAKTFYDDVSNKNMKAYTTLEQVGLTEDVSSMDEILTAIPFSTYFNISTGLFTNRTTLFPGKFQSVGFLKIERTSTGRPLILYSEKETDVLYKGYLNGDGTFKAWGRLCTTSVDDVPWTKIIFTDSTKYTNYNSSLSNYIVKNGICYVSLDISVISKQSNWITVYTSLPRPIMGKINVSHSFVDEVGDSYLAYGVWEDGTLKIKSGENNIRYLGNFSYPIAES